MNSHTLALCHSSDQALEQLLEEITDRFQTGLPVDLEQYVVAHPEYEERLRSLLPAMQLLMAFGLSQSAQSATKNGPESASTSLPASGVLGDFRLVREIGRGGMGVVYEAEQISIGRPVALKVLPFASMLDEKRLARFRNEVRAAGQLHHTNIVPIYAVGSDRGVHFYAMQLVVGQTLAEIIAAMKPGRPPSDERLDSPSSLHNQSTAADTARAALSTLRSIGGTAFFRTVAQLAQQAAEALEHAHTCGIVHRDIKPSNLLIDERGTLWLTDFGLASVDAGSDLTMTGDLLGTLRYMSPEQSRGSRVVLDHRTDIYSLGVTLYELLTLEPAFDATARAELLRQITDEEPRAPRRIDPSIPSDLETIVLKAMQKDPAGRYATAQELANDLRRFLEHKPIVARRPSFMDRSRKWITRHAALVALAAAVLAIVATVVAAAAWLTLGAYRSESQQRATAEANLAIASQTIDRLLSRVANDHYYHGDLAHAETLAADATEFYEKLLQQSDDPALRFRAAKAHGDVSHIWQLVGRHEKAGVANRRAGELLQRLTTQHPERTEYLAALAANFNHIGLVDWSLDRPLAAEPSFRQAWEIWTELADRFPNEPTYQSGLAGMLANLGSVCYFSDRFDEAEEYYRRAEAIEKLLPVELKNTAEGLASQAGSCTNQAELARLRGQYDRALELLEQSIPLHKQSLEKWSTNPVALDCYFHTHWNIVECNLGAGRPIEAAAAVERLVETFPDHLSAYHEGAVQLLRCAALASREGEARAEPLETPANDSAGASPSQIYRQRAHELVAKAPEALQRTPDTTSRFAWFLLMCADQSFRDAPQALELAKSVVKDVPERGDTWFTLALAQYRNKNWQAADEAVQKSIKLSRDDTSLAYDWLLLAMIRSQQGQTDKARQWHKRANDWIAENDPKDEDLLSLAAETDGLVHAKN